MAGSVAQQAITLLIDLAEQGEIDPWDVQVIDVIDRFLAQMAPTANTHDLSESGQAILHAAMLVYLKAMALADPVVDEVEPDLDTPDLASDPLRDWTPRQLDQVLQTRAVPRLARTRPVTLKDLISHLQELETVLQNRPDPTPKPLTQRLSRSQAMAAITQLAHPENLLETTAELEAWLAQQWQQGIAQLSFEQLLARFQPTPDPQAEHDSASPTPHRIQLFWSLLLMASRSQVQLEQQDFYQDLTILPITSC